MEFIITAIREELPELKTFFLKPPAAEPLLIRPGQFLTFLHTVQGREERRSYSWSGIRGREGELSITVKRIANGLMSRWLIDHAKPGDVLQAEGGATGVFTLPAEPDRFKAVWLFAAGIGITPIFSLLNALLAEGQAEVVLVYSNHRRGVAVFGEELLHLEREYPDRLSIVWLWSDNRDLRRARMSREYFPLLMKEHLATPPSDALCYICGPASYMWLVQLLLVDAGVPAAQIRREVFVIDKEVPKRLPADKAPHRVIVQATDSTYSFISTYPDSILKSAKKAGISLQYSCETGQCGSCTAICNSGKVWMSYNEVLTEKDLAAGRVLTCTGHAVGGDVGLIVGNQLEVVDSR